MTRTNRKQRLVLIDDSEVDRARVRALLKGAPERRYEFLEANNATDGLVLCQPGAEPPIDCVLVDVHMSDMTGVELVDRLRRENGFPRLPIVVLTGSHGVSAAEQALSSGAQDYLPKDAVLPELLPRIVDNAIARHRMMLRYQENERIAELANQAKSAFIAHMSHEIRTPMTAVLGYAALLEEHEQDEEKIRYLETIKRNGTFLLEIINDILDLSKIEAGKMELEYRSFSPQKLVAEVYSMMEGRASEKQLALNVEFDGPLPRTIRSDARRLKQILVNLLGNAIKFTEEGSVLLTVRYFEGDPARLEFEVRDTGIGMTEEQQAALFQPFSQGDASVNRRFGGTGLGLTISQRLAAMLGGSITFSSRTGEGSTFTCRIGAGSHSPEMVAQPTMVSEATSSLSDLPTNLRCRALVVDDRRDVRFLTKQFLEKSGVEVCVAEDGEQGLEFVQQILAEEIPPVDLILLDMQMPRLDGYETASRLRAMGYDKPIIALTADAMHGDMSRCLACGCNSYLSKPIDVRKLLETVARYTEPD